MVRKNHRESLRLSLTIHPKDFGLEEYLTLVQATRGISAFRVVIDSTNNQAAKVNSGILAVAIIITPILAVREIQLTLVISKEGLTVTEAEIASF